MTALPAVREARDTEAVRALFPVLCQLRPHLAGPEDLVARVARMAKDGYRLVWTSAVPDGPPVAAAGFRIFETLFAGPMLYVDDLVTLEARRGQGDGARLMGWLRAEARRHGCKELHLDSGTQRLAAHRFYFARGLAIRSFHFATGLED